MNLIPKVQADLTVAYIAGVYHRKLIFKENQQKAAITKSNHGVYLGVDQAGRTFLMKKKQKKTSRRIEIIIVCHHAGYHRRISTTENHIFPF